MRYVVNVGVEDFLANWLNTFAERESADQLLAEIGNDTNRFFVSVRGNHHLEIVNDITRFNILDSVEQLTHDTEARRHDATRVTTVHAFIQHFHSHRSHQAT